MATTNSTEFHTNTDGTVHFVEEDVAGFLNYAITQWRTSRDEATTGHTYDMATHYIDAFQSVRCSDLP